MMPCYWVCRFMDPLFQTYKVCRGVLSFLGNGTCGVVTYIASSCKLVYAPFGVIDQFSVDAVECYGRALQQAEKVGVHVRALVLVNPHNPLGMYCVIRWYAEQGES